MFFQCFVFGWLGEKKCIESVMYGLKLELFLLLSFASLKAMANQQWRNQQWKSGQGSSGSWQSAGSGSWWYVSAAAEEDPYSISAAAEEDPYSEPPAAPAAALAIEDAAPVAAVAVAPFRMQPLPQWRLPLQDAPPLAAVAVAPFGAALALEDAAPAAIAAGAQPANDGQPDPQVFDLNYFQSFQPFTSGWKQHNAALKFFRGQQELHDDPMQSPCLQFHVSTPTAVAVIKHAPKA